MRLSQIKEKLDSAQKIVAEVKKNLYDSTRDKLDKNKPTYEFETLPNLQPKDAPNLKKVVDALKKQGAEVYVTGSVLENTGYNDIDLVVDIPSPREEGKTEIVVKYLKENGVKVLNRKPFDEPYGYAGSLLLTRHRINVRGTIIDISETTDPFEYNPLEKRWIKFLKI